LFGLDTTLFLLETDGAIEFSVMFGFDKLKGSGLVGFEKINDLCYYGDSCARTAP
jgi:hypothetical protein